MMVWWGCSGTDFRLRVGTLSSTGAKLICVLSARPYNSDNITLIHFTPIPNCGSSPCFDTNYYSIIMNPTQMIIKSIFVRANE